MTKDEAKIIILKDLLRQSYATIDFLSDCLNNKATYTYPELTEKTLKNISRYIELPKYCHHSSMHKECEACRDHVDWYSKLDHAYRILEDANI